MLRTNLWSSPICGGLTPGRAVDHRRDGCEYTALVPILCLFYHLQYGINTFHALSALAAGVRRRAGGTEGGGAATRTKVRSTRGKVRTERALSLVHARGFCNRTRMVGEAVGLPKLRVQCRRTDTPYPKMSER